MNKTTKIVRLASRLLLMSFPFGRYFCVFCKKRPLRFLPYINTFGKESELIDALNVVGSNMNQFLCPFCNSHDRERHLLLFLEASNLIKYIYDKDVIHFAPETHISTMVSKLGPSRYIKCDLIAASDDVIPINIQSIPFPNESFDIAIANHVLEHVVDDLKGLAEIYRILKIGGYAILQTPYSERLHRTWSDPGINSDRSRFCAYGQEDHLRLYGLDIFDRFTSIGLTSLVKKHEELIPISGSKRYGINLKEPFFLFQKLR